ncbi:MAG: hypothetical protein HFH68_05325 [Lachnospiraceae bacterium]|nr:hypothetical protein [Lachnospiraceae bacterium]
MDNVFAKRVYPASACVYNFLKNKLHLSLNSNKIENIKKIYTGLDNTNAARLYFYKLFSIIIVVVICTLLLIMLITVTSGKKNILEKGYFIKRDKPEGSNTEANLDVCIDGEEQEIMLDIPARKYNDNELEIKFNEAMEYTRKNYLGKNTSPEKVDRDLNLISYIPDSAISISWECDTGNIVNNDGTLERSQVTEPVVVQIIAVFSYYEIEKTMPLEFTVLPVNKSRKEIIWDKWNEMFSELSDLSGSKEFLQLPAEAGGEKVSYKVTEKNYIMPVIILGIIIIVLIPVITDSRLNENIKQREQELRIDYPGFVEKFVLLINAGLNCKGAWYRMADEYKKTLLDGGKKRYLYEEMLLTKRHMESGMNEAKAYELFGRRTGLLKYMKFSTLLVQNLKKGSDGLLKILEYEAVDVLKERRENARILGEQAGTKLLMPMVIMMTEVFIIIIYAAFQNM